jgi:hypothetical protein
MSPIEKQRPWPRALAAKFLAHPALMRKDPPESRLLSVVTPIMTKPGRRPDLCLSMMSPLLRPLPGEGVATRVSARPKYRADKVTSSCRGTGG